MHCHDHDCAPEIARLKAERDNLAANCTNYQRTIDAVRKIVPLRDEDDAESVADAVARTVEGLEYEIRTTKDRHREVEKIAGYLPTENDAELGAAKMRKRAQRAEAALAAERGMRARVEADRDVAWARVKEKYAAADLKTAHAVAQAAKVRIDLDAAHREIARLSSGVTLEADGMVCTFPGHASVDRNEIDAIATLLTDANIPGPYPLDGVRWLLERHRAAQAVASDVPQPVSEPYTRWLGQRPRKPPAVAIRVAPTCLEPGGPRCLDYCACGDGAGPHAPANYPAVPDGSVEQQQPSMIYLSLDDVPAGVVPPPRPSHPEATAGAAPAGVSLPRHGPARWLLPSDARHPGHAAWVRERSP